MKEKKQEQLKMKYKKSSQEEIIPPQSMVGGQWGQEKETPEKLLRNLKERELKFKNKWETN